MAGRRESHGPRKDARSRGGRPAGAPKPASDLLPRIRELESRVGKLAAENEQLRERRAKTRVLASARQLQATLDAIRDAICLLDWQGRILRCNRTFEAFVGKTSEEILGRFYPEVMRLIPSFVEAAPIERAWQLRSRVGIDFAVEDRWFHVTTDPLLDERGESGGAVCVIRDMTVRKETEQELRESELKFRMTMEQVPAIVWTTDRDLRITSSFGNGLRVLGRQPSDQVGKTMFESVGNEDPSYLPNAMHLRALAGEAVTYEMEFEGRAWTTHIEPLRGAQGGIVGTIGLTVDNTDRTRAERALSESEDILRRVFDAAPIGISLVSEDRRYLAVNAALCRMLGYAQEELIGKTFVEVSHPDDVPPSLEVERRGREPSAEPITFEKRYVRKTGETIWARLSVRGIFDAEGRFQHWLTMTEDITQRKMLEEQLRQSYKLEALGRFAGGVAHDFNNLLGAIKGYADLVVRGREGDEALLRDVGEIRNVIAHASDLTRQLLTIGRPQPLQARPIDLGAVLAGIAGMIRRLVGEAIQVEVASDPALRVVTADPGQIEQVVMNLAANARDAMPAGGMLRITTRNVDIAAEYASRQVGVRAGPHVVLSVADTGTGMDAQALAHLFEPFFTTKANGGGLGLSIVYGIARQAGGHVTVESVPGKGTSVQVCFPATT